jgi:hypothetical protein
MFRRIACVLILAACSTASACINDEESPSREREFRSTYLRARSMLVGTPSGESGGRFIDEKWLQAGGAAMLVGALAFSARRQRSGSKRCEGDGQDLS